MITRTHCDWTNDHSEIACNALREYESQPGVSSKAKPLSFYAEKYGLTTDQLKHHWHCKENCVDSTTSQT